MRSLAFRKEVQRQLPSYEVRLMPGIFRGDLALDSEFAARSRESRLDFLRKSGGTIQALRAQRIQHNRAMPLAGQGYRKTSAMAATCFELLISSRHIRSLGCTRLAFVASTRETLAGAPPLLKLIAKSSP
jgi:hypothetical protein